MRITRRSALAASLAVLVGPLAVEAQPSARGARVGVLESSSPSSFPDRLEALRRGFVQLGYVEGQTILFEYRWAYGKISDLPGLAAGLVRLQVDIIVAGTTPAALAAKNATSTIPIVFAVPADPVGVGLVAGLSRPGGNVTGLTVLGVSLRPLPVKSPEDFDGAFAAIASGGIDALYVAAGALTDAHAGRLAERAARVRVPAIYSARGFVEAGGQMSYSANFADNYRRAATYADKILRGAKPSDLPVEQASTFELAVNLRTANALRLSIPPSVRLRADVVVE